MIGVGRNIISIGIGQVSNMLINLVAITFAAKHLGVETFGLFSYLLAIVGIVSKIIDLGLGPIVLREISKDNSNLFLLRSAISIRILLSLVLFLVLNVFVFLFNFTNIEILLLNILLLNILFSSKFQNLRELADIPFKSKLKMHIPMTILIFENLLFLALVFLMIRLNEGVLFFVIVYCISNIPGFMVMFYFLKREFNFKIGFDFTNISWLIKQSFPIYMLIMLISIFQQLDNIVLKYLSNLTAAGYYSAAVRLTMPLQFIITPVVITAFPLIVQNINKKEENNKFISMFIYKFLFFVSFTIAAIGSFKSREFILFIYGAEFAMSELPFVFLLWTQVFIFFNFFSLDLVTAINKQGYASIYAMVIVIVNIAALAIFVPSYSYTGAAIAKLIASFAGTVYLTVILKKILLHYNFIRLNIIFWSLLILVLFNFTSRLDTPLYIGLSIIIIILVTIVTKFFSKDEFNILLKLLRVDSIIGKNK